MAAPHNGGNNKDDTGFVSDDSLTMSNPPRTPLPPCVSQVHVASCGLRVLPLLVVVYALVLIDARTLGWIVWPAWEQTSFQIEHGNRYTIVSVIDLPAYILLNLLLHRISPRILLSIITIFLRAVQLSEAFVPSWGYCRALHGACEAGFFPAITYIISTWRVSFSSLSRSFCPWLILGSRLAAFFLLSSLISGFSSILAYALNLLKGKQGLNGWQWIFIIEGAATMFFGIAVFFFAPDFPDRNRFLTLAQTRLVLKRLEDDRVDFVPDEPTFGKVMEHLADWKLWVYGLILITQAASAYFVGFFLPIILSAMRWETRDALLLSAPPYGTALVCALGFEWILDKTRLLAPFLVILAFVTIIGLVLTAFHRNSNIYFAGRLVLFRAANNVVSQSKRAVSTAIIIAFDGVGGIIATTAFRQQDLPRYIPGLWATMACQVLRLTLLGIMTLYFLHENKRVREGTAAEPIEGRRGF